MTDLDRMLRDAMRVEPGGDFAARIRTRVAASPRQSRALMPRFALAGIACAVVAVIATNVWRGPDTSVAQSVLPHRDLIVFAQPTRVVSSPPRLALLAAPAANDVMVSRSEMLALQRLFAGLTVAPPGLAAPPDELTIPEIVIEPIAPLVSGPEGERQ